MGTSISIIIRASASQQSIIITTTPPPMAIQAWVRSAKWSRRYPASSGTRLASR